MIPKSHGRWPGELIKTTWKDFEYILIIHFNSFVRQCDIYRMSIPKSHGRWPGELKKTTWKDLRVYLNYPF